MFISEKKILFKLGFDFLYFTADKKKTKRDLWKLNETIN